MLFKYNVVQHFLISFTVLDEFCEDIDLSGIHILENDMKLIEKHRKQILNRTRSLLMDALKEQNEIQVN